MWPFGKKKFVPPEDIFDVIKMVREANHLYDLWVTKGDKKAKARLKAITVHWHQNSERGLRRAKRLADRIEQLGPFRAESRVDELYRIVRKRPQPVGANIFTG